LLIILDCLHCCAAGLFTCLFVCFFADWHSPPVHYARLLTKWQQIKVSKRVIGCNNIKSMEHKYKGLKENSSKYWISKLTEIELQRNTKKSAKLNGSFVDFHLSWIWHGVCLEEGPKLNINTIWHFWFHLCTQACLEQGLKLKMNNIWPNCFCRLLQGLFLFNSALKKLLLGKNRNIHFENIFLYKSNVKENIKFASDAYTRSHNSFYCILLITICFLALSAVAVVMSRASKRRNPGI
jgi:hypothetical protein